MMSWDDLRCLACVGRGQTLTSAARTLQTSISTVSRRIERLNNDSSEQIAIKNGNTWTLTNHGKQIAEAAIKFQEQLDKAEADSIYKGKGKLKPRVITLTAPDALISYYLTPVLTDFASREPSIELNIISNPFGKRLGDGSVDMAILLGKPVIGRHIVKKIGTIRDGIFCKTGTTATNWIGLDRSLDELEMMHMGRRFFGKEPDLRISNLSLIKKAVEASGWAGVGMDVLYPKSEGFQSVGGEDTMSETSVWLSYHETRRFDKALQIIRDFMISALKR